MGLFLLLNQSGKDLQCKDSNFKTMNYNQATLYAATGKVLMFPDWHGYFYWNYETKELNFRDGDYHLDYNH